MANDRETAPSRKSVHLENYDYSQEGAYSVTVCAKGNRPLFGEVVDGHVALSGCGRVVAECIEAIPDHFPRCTLDVSVVMPNHLHLIIVIDRSAESAGASREPPNCRSGPKRGAISAVVGSVKSAASKLVNRVPEGRRILTWQRGYYEHVIRSEREMLAIRQYIVNNPLQWELDRENPDRAGRHPLDRWLYGE